MMKSGRERRLGASLHAFPLTNHELTFPQLHFTAFSALSCIDRMEGVTMNAVIAVPDEKYGEVSCSTITHERLKG